MSLIGQKVKGISFPPPTAGMMTKINLLTNIAWGDIFLFPCFSSPSSNWGIHWIFSATCPLSLSRWQILWWPRPQVLAPLEVGDHDLVSPVVLNTGLCMQQALKNPNTIIKMYSMGHHAHKKLKICIEWLNIILSIKSHLETT